MSVSTLPLRPRLVTPEPAKVFAGESARVWHARQTCQRSGAAFEITNARKTLGRMALEAAVLIATGLVILNLIGRVMS